MTHQGASAARLLTQRARILPAESGSGLVPVTNKAGFDGIRSQPTWTFRASQPPAAHNPVGAYFTTYEQDEHNLAVKLFLPREKLHYIFSFIDRGELLPLPGGRGRLKRIFYSPVTYEVERERQTFHGRTGIE